MAAKWLYVIRRWFVMRIDAVTIELDCLWPPGTVKTVVRNIRRAVAGDRQDGEQRTGRPRGRPKKIPASSTVLELAAA
jgi:hypothetical protein